MPDDIFSLKGIFSLTSQILGFTWDRVRVIGVKVIGEPIIKALEIGFDIVMILKNEGIAGLWEYIKEQFNDLKETVMNAIMDMIQSQVIQAGIKWILGLLSPVGAFIKACMAIIDVVVFFVQRAKQIMELIDAFLDSILAVASGSVGAVANLIENALARAVPVLIGFLASLLGLSGLAAKVTKIFQKIQQRVEKAITKLWMKLKEMGKKVLAKLGIGEKEKPKNKEEHDAQVTAGMTYLHQQEQAEDHDGNKALTFEEANKVAASTKKKFPVFTSIVPREVGGKWVYEWTGSKGDEDGANVEGGTGTGDPLKLKEQSQELIDKMSSSLEKDETVKRDYSPVLRELSKKWNDNSHELKESGDDPDLITIIIDEYKDIITETKKIQKEINKRVPEEETDDRKIVLDLLKKSIHVPPADYGRAKHWSGNSEDQRRESSKDGGAGQFLHSLSASDVKALEIEAIKKGEIVKHSASTYHFFYTFSTIVGYENGNESSYMRVEMTNIGSTPTIHSHPR